jgi:hypothetical protein
MVHEIVSTIFLFKFEEELDISGDCNLGIRAENGFNMLDPTRKIFHGLGVIQVGLSDDTQGAIAAKI